MLYQSYYEQLHHLIKLPNHPPDNCVRMFLSLGFSDSHLMCNFNFQGLATLHAEAVPVFQHTLLSPIFTVHKASLTLKMVAAVCAETVEQLHNIRTTWLNSESWSYTCDKNVLGTSLVWEAGLNKLLYSLCLPLKFTMTQLL
jgi:hypothetical protein